VGHVKLQVLHMLLDGLLQQLLIMLALGFQIK